MKVSHHSLESTWFLPIMIRIVSRKLKRSWATHARGGRKVSGQNYDPHGCTTSTQRYAGDDRPGIAIGG